jgi:hypothetical protein
MFDLRGRYEPPDLQPFDFESAAVCREEVDGTKCDSGTRCKAGQNGGGNEEIAIEAAVMKLDTSSAAKMGGVTPKAQSIPGLPIPPIRSAINFAMGDGAIYRYLPPC